MNKRTLLSLFALVLVTGWEDYLIQPMPAGAESEAGLEAPMFVGGRRGRRRGRRYNNNYNNQQQMQQQMQQQKMEANILKQDQMEDRRHQQTLQRMGEKDIVHEYGAGASKKFSGNGQNSGNSWYGGGNSAANGGGRNGGGRGGGHGRKRMKQQQQQQQSQQPQP